MATYKNLTMHLMGRGMKLRYGTMQGPQGAMQPDRTTRER